MHSVRPRHPSSLRQVHCSHSGSRVLRVLGQPTPRHPVHDTGYSEALEAARQRSGKDEAVLTGAGTIDGKAVVIIAGEFAFLAGSIGLATASRIIGALERATLEGLPVVASPSSGGDPHARRNTRFPGHGAYCLRCGKP